jgi:hypothetical protein
MLKRMLLLLVLVSVVGTAAANAHPAAPAPAQSSKASDLLTPLQVKALITSAKTPADHIKLQRHFVALAVRYEAEATEHADLAKLYRSNPGSHYPGNNAQQAVHCDRLSELTLEGAKAARALASDHEKMAGAK